MAIRYLAPIFAAALISAAAVADENVHEHEASADHETHHESDAHDDDESHDHDHAAGSAHVHGLWSLFAALDGEMLSVTLTGPLQDVLGFETVPDTVEEQSALEAMLKDLSDADALLSINARAKCTLASSVDVSLPEDFIGSETDHSEDAHDHDAHEADEHDHTADIDVTLAYNCEAPGRLGDLDVKIFSAYPAIETLDAVFLGDTGQVARRLSREDAVLSTD
ncbi:MAG: DUF2796 domain-containing protein [Pseudomonadota bacterium]